MGLLDEVLGDNDLGVEATAAAVGVVSLTTTTTPRRFKTALLTQAASQIKDETGVLLAVWVPVSGANPAHWNYTKAGRIRLEVENAEGTVVGGSGGPIL
jgi:hypothetical protein